MYPALIKPVLLFLCLRRIAHGNKCKGVKPVGVAEDGFCLFHSVL